MQWIFPHFLVDVSLTKGSLQPTKPVSAKFKSQAYPLLALGFQMPHYITHWTSVCQAWAVFEGTYQILREKENEYTLMFTHRSLLPGKKHLQMVYKPYTKW